MYMFTRICSQAHTVFSLLMADQATTGGASQPAEAKEHVERRIANDGIAYTKAEFKTHYGIITGEKRWDEAIDQAEVWTRETYEMVKQVARSARETKACEDVKTGGAPEHVEEQCLRVSPSKLRRPPRWPESQQ